MKTFMTKFGPLVAGVAMFMAMVGMNSTCCFTNHQPGVPEEAAKLRRF